LVDLVKLINPQGICISGDTMDDEKKGLIAFISVLVFLIVACAIAGGYIGALVEEGEVATSEVIEKSTYTQIYNVTFVDDNGTRIEDETYYLVNGPQIYVVKTIDGETHEVTQEEYESIGLGTYFTQPSSLLIYVGAIIGGLLGLLLFVSLADIAEYLGLV